MSIAPATTAGVHPSRLTLIWLVAAATALPAMQGLALPPMPTAINQLLAVFLWGAVSIFCAPLAAARNGLPLFAAGCVLLLAAALSFGFGSLPMSLTVLAVGLLGAALLTACAAAALGASADARRSIIWFWWAVLAAGLYNSLVGITQALAPWLADGLLIARTDLPGRAIGNLRHPNQLGLWLLWSLLAAVALHAQDQLRARWMWLAGGILLVAISLTGSRAAVASLLMLAVWAGMDGRMPAAARRMLWAAPLLLGLTALAIAAVGTANDPLPGLAGRSMTEGIQDSNSRLLIWSNSLSLLRDHPWTGVGFGEFNLAWTLTAFPHKPTALFDHSHNLVLQILVELGLPLGALLLVLLGLALWRAWPAHRNPDGKLASAARCVIAMIGLALWHNMLEHSAWFGHLLLPLVFAWGWLLGVAAPGLEKIERANVARVGVVLVSGLVCLGAALATLEYRKVSALYAQAMTGQPPAAAAIRQAQQAFFFTHLADHAATVYPTTLGSRGVGLTRGMHWLVDPTFLARWASYLADQGEVDKARLLVDRLREFRSPASADFLARCSDAREPRPFHCTPPISQYSWRDFQDVPLPAARR